MKKVFALLLLTTVLMSCKMIVNDIKKTNKVRKIALEHCECKLAEVDKSYRGGNSIMEITLKKWWSTDHLLTAENVFTAIQDSFPKICNFGEVSIVFEHEGFDERFLFYGCEHEPETDTVFWDVDDEPSDTGEYTDDDWDNFMNEEDSLAGN